MKALLLILLFGSLVSALPTSAAEPGRQSDIDQARKAAMERGAYQTDLPLGRGKRPPEGESMFGWLDALAPFMGFLIRAVAILAIAILLIFVVRSALDRLAENRAHAGEADRAAVSIRGEDFRIDMDEIRLLAGAGKFGEAIHALLLRTLQELCRLSALEIGQAKTSREILQEFPLESAPRRDLAALVNATELAYFGLRDATDDDYRDCLSHFERFVSSLGGGVS